MRCACYPSSATGGSREITRKTCRTSSTGSSLGLSAEHVGVTLLPLRAIYRRAIARGEVAVNPTTGLEMPAIRGGRDRIATPEECRELLAALPQRTGRCGRPRCTPGSSRRADGAPGRGRRPRRRA